MTFAAMCRELVRPPVSVRALQSRFQLPAFGGSKYSAAYLEFLRVIVFLRALNVSEETLRELWDLERKLLTLLHVDSSGSQTWFLDACGQRRHRDRRLLLSNYDMGVPLPADVLQPELDFNERPPELFSGREMGEDELRLLNEYLRRVGRVRESVRAEIPAVLAAVRWSRRRLACDIRPA
jgi:hypothetical protein